MAEQYDIAHLNVRGVDIIVVFVDERIHHISAADKNAVLTRLQFCAASAGLAGAVTLVWLYSGRVHFLGPKNQHAFYRSTTFEYLWNSRNRTLTCG